MPTEYGGVECPKPQKAQRTRARAKRHESKVASEVRAQCVLRDGDCRLAGLRGMGPCSGESEWAHLDDDGTGVDKRRFATRGQEAEVRHTVRGSLMACTGHHQAYDRHGLSITPLTALGADGTLRVKCGGVSVLSVPRAQP